MMKFKKHFILSFVGHMIVLIGAFVIFLFSNSAGDKKNKNILPVYVYQAVEQKNQAQVQHNKTEQHPETHAIALEKTDHKIQSTHRSVSRSIVQNPLTGNDSRELLKILHNLIAEKQVYPEVAKSLNQSGTVKIGMMINPDGQIKNISILKSSGFDSIDSAALSTVQAIPSIKEAHLYLQHEEYFSVDIIYNLI